MSKLQFVYVSDMQPVVHGRIVDQWNEGYVHYQVCSECNKSWSGSSNYCPNCGAKMDGRRDNDRP